MAQTIILISCRDTSVGSFGIGIAVAAAGGGVFGGWLWCSCGLAHCGGEGGVVSVFQGVFASVGKILNLAGGLGAGVAHGH